MEKLEGSQLYCSQLRATLVKNLLLKKREKRRTIAEVLLPLYSLGILILIKLCIPNPNFPPMETPLQQHASLFKDFRSWMNHTIAFVPNTTEVLEFLSTVDSLWSDYQKTHHELDLNAEKHHYHDKHHQRHKRHRNVTHLEDKNINWVGYTSKDEMVKAYWKNPQQFPIAVMFDEHEGPIGGALKYEIRTNPSFVETPSTTTLFSSPANCRHTTSLLSINQQFSELFPLELGDTCPVNQYYYSGFVALQALLDYAKIQIDTGKNITMANIQLLMFPKEAYTSRWIMAFRMVIPFYMVMSVSQFITYLLMLIVGEKEKKIKEGMKIMGLKDSVFWLSWFIIYAMFVLWLSVTCCLLIYLLNVFQHTNMFLIFILTFLYALTVIMFSFMLTPFFDKSRTAGILGNFAVNILSALYILQIFFSDSSVVAFYFISLVSSSGYALAMDKALVLDLKGEGITFKNVWSSEHGMPFAGSILMMVVDIILYGALAIYFDSVIPSEHGVKRSPFFCFKFKRRTAPSALLNGESSPSPDVEPVARELKSREAIRIVDLCKSFKKGKQKAVNGIDLTMYEGQITAILGHNGAGKTTLFNMLTGLTQPTSGTAYIFGYDIRDPQDMERVREITGVCPQHDILFDSLTAREHLQFFAAVKGLHPGVRDRQVAKILRDVDLDKRADVPSRYLSGGQKRKLSVAIAIIGDPKIIILDEPTAGVDPYSRRHLWSVLQNRKHGKVILLITHFMDEADILADRKAVVSKGKVRCCGSSLFLKNKFGIGYHLTLVLDGTCREKAIERLVTSHVPKAEKARRHGRELSFILPHNAVDHFPGLFSAIESEIATRASHLGISCYGVSMTTLEEVFLHLERDTSDNVEVENENDNENDDVEDLSKKMVRNRALSRSLSLQSKQEKENGNVESEKKTPSTDCNGLDSIVDDRSPGFSNSFLHMKCEPSSAFIFIALLKLRCLRLIRDMQKLYLMILLPLGLAALSLYMNSAQSSSEPKEKSIMLDPELYENQSKIVVHNETQSTINTFMDQLEILGAHLDDYSGNYTSLLSIAPNLGAINVRSLNHHLGFTLLYNDTYTHSLPLLINLLNNAVYRLLSDDRLARGSWSPIEISVAQLPQTRQPEEFNVGVFCTSLFIGMIFVLVPGNLAIDMVYDRQIRAKNQLRVNGLGFGLYFMSYFTVLSALVLLIVCALLGIVILFDIPSMRDPPALIVLCGLIIIYCPASILYNTCLSYIFDRMDSAQAFLPHIATSVGYFPFLLVIFLDMMRIGGKAPFILHTFLSILNPMYVPYAIIYYVQRVYLMCIINSACVELTFQDYMTDEIIVIIVGTLLNIIILSGILVLLDALCSSGNVREAFKMFKLQKSKNEEVDDSDCGENEDIDVKCERQKVVSMLRDQSQTPPVVMVQSLHKAYNTQTCASRFSSCCDSSTIRPLKVAIKSLSFAVDAGEVFGLLGHNGAGKTTTMKIVTAEEAPTRGRVHIGGHSITSNLSEAFKVMGYCPQHDALWKNITVREHLECYAAIRGVPQRLIKQVIESYMHGLQIKEHADKHAGQCSGGTRRKLSFAIASIGNPKVVLMDEPSTGMDPRSKRFLWDTILASFQGSRGAILTTHSMEEADALCSRVGIMVQGELRCLGSTQHLKNLYGAGYTLEVKHRGGERTPTESMSSLGAGEARVDPHESLKQFVDELFPESKLVESFADRFVFSVPQNSVLSLANCFSQLEKAKQELDIVEYSFSQTTLEQVFLKFLAEEENNCNNNERSEHE